MKSIAKILLKPTVHVVKISGLITEKTVEQLEKHLKEIRTSTTKAIALVISSPEILQIIDDKVIHFIHTHLKQGGSPTQSEKIINKIHFFAEKYNLPVYTFAEELATSAAYQILISGKRVYADENSLVGSIGAITKIFNAKAILESQGLEMRRVSTNPSSFSNFSIANDVPDELRAVFQDQMKIAHTKFIEYVEKERNDKITVLIQRNLHISHDYFLVYQVPLGERKHAIYNGDIFTGREAKQYGLVDEIGRLEEVIRYEFPSAKIVFAKKPTYTGKWVEYAKLLNIFQTLFAK